MTEYTVYYDNNVWTILRRDVNDYDSPYWTKYAEAPNSWVAQEIVTALNSQEAM